MNSSNLRLLLLLLLTTQNLLFSQDKQSEKMDSLANYFMGKKELDSAKFYSSNLVNHLKEKKETKDLFYAKSQDRLGSVLKKLGHYDESLTSYKESKELIESIKGRKSVDYAKVINNLAGLYIKMGLFDQAHPLRIETIKIVEKTFREAS